MRTSIPFLLFLWIACVTGCPGTDDDDDIAVDDDDDDDDTTDDDDTADDDDSADDDDDDDTGDDDTGEDGDGDGFDADVDCDDGDAAITPVWVSVTVPTGGDGTQASPFSTIADGIAAGTGCVRLLGGVYDESLTITADVILYGVGGLAAVRIDTAGMNRMFDVEGGAHLVLEGITLHGGSSTEGGCIRVVGAALTMRQSMLSECYASENGGAILADVAQVTLEQVEVLGDSTPGDNSAGGDGGGLWLDESELTLDRCTFDGLVAGDYGGAVYIEEGTSVIQRCRFVGNEAADGGALEIFGEGSQEVTGCLFDGNSTTVDGDLTYGGAIDSFGSSLLVRQCAFVDNVAIYGAGIYYNTSDPADALEIRNSVLFSQDGSALYLGGLATLATSDVMYNDFFSNTSILNLSDDTSDFDISNLFVDPEFVDYQGNAQTNDFHLAGGSPLIDAGDPDPAWNDTDTSRSDMGCFGGPIPLP